MMAFNYPGSYNFYRPRPNRPTSYACFPDAYDCAGDSYANTLFEPPFTRRRPSPPPTTFVPRNASPNDYVRALAEEQAARNALAEAIQREKAARVRRERAEAEARLRAQEEARRKALEREYQRRARPQTMFGYPFGYAAYPQEAYGSDEEEEEQESASPFDAFFYPATRSRPSPSPLHRRSPSQGEAQAQRVPPQMRQRSPLHTSSSSDEEKLSSSPKSESVKIPVTSPAEPEAVPVPISRSQPTEKEIDAVTKIQTLFRQHIARRSALKQIESIEARLNELRTGFTFPTELDFDEDPATYLAKVNQRPETEDEDAMDVEEEATRPKLAYTARNTPVHAYEDALLKLLQALDTVESGGDLFVREARRAVVREVEEELKKVDDNVRAKWKVVLDAHSASSEKKEEEEVDQKMVVEESAPEPSAEETMSIDESQNEAEPSTASDSTQPTFEETMDVEPIPEPAPVVAPESIAAPSSEPIVTEPKDDTSLSSASSSVSDITETNLDVTTAQEPIIEEVESSDQSAPASVSISLPHEVLPEGDLSVQEVVETELNEASSSRRSAPTEVVFAESASTDPEVPLTSDEDSPLQRSISQSTVSDGDEVFSDAEEGPVSEAESDIVHVGQQAEPQVVQPRPEHKDDMSEDTEFVLL